MIDSTLTFVTLPVGIAGEPVVSEMNSEKLWELFGKFALVVTVLGALVGLWTWYQSPSKELEATVERGALYLPPKYQEFSAAVSDAIAPENLQGAFNEIERLTGGDFQIPSGSPLMLVSQSLREKLKLDDPSQQLIFNGYWHATVVNTGDVFVEDVVLRLPDATASVIRREDQAKTTEAHGPIIELGKIGAGQRVNVTAWTITPPVEWATQQKPTLHHAGGPGRIKPKRDNALDTKSLFLAAFIIATIVTLFDSLIKPFVLKRLGINTKKQ